MDDDTVWRHVDEQRRAVADLAASLRTEEWESPSLCAGWRVREVLAHLTMEATPRVVVVEMLRARGDFDRMIDGTARRLARRSEEELVGLLRDRVGKRRTPPGGAPMDPLGDVLVHTQDVVRPLGRHHAVPPEAAAAVATRIWERGFPHHAQRRLAGRRLVATDVDWAVGEGEETRAPIADLLLLVTGRDPWRVSR